jgi:hypothetical protein
MLKADELTKDVIALGLQNLTAGGKNPLAEYNGAFKRLQKRRNMNQPPIRLHLLHLLRLLDPLRDLNLGFHV